jgi:hypothetical protein
VHPYATMTRRAALSSAIHVIIFGVKNAGGVVLATAVTVESCAAVTHAKTMSVTIFTLIQCCRMKIVTETETETLVLGMELTSRII